MRTYAPPTQMVSPVRSRLAASRGFGATVSTPTWYACNGFRLDRVIILVMLAFSTLSLYLLNWYRWSCGWCRMKRVLPVESSSSC